MKSQGSSYTIPRKKGYWRHVERLVEEGREIWDVEHYRVQHDIVTEQPFETPIHVACIVDMDGRVALGIAVCNGYGIGEDQYSRSRGHEIALGKALANFVNEKFVAKKVDITRYSGVQLRDHLRPFAEQRASRRMSKLAVRMWGR